MGVVKKKKRRVELWEQNPHCHWCGRLTSIDYLPDGIGFSTQATVDHLFNRLDPQRHTNGNGNKQVLACYECNARRGKEYQQEQQRLLNLNAFNKEERPLIEPPRLTYCLAEIYPEFILKM